MVVLIIVSSDARMLGSVQRWFLARRRTVFACQSGLLCVDDIWGTLGVNLLWCPSLFLLLFFLVFLLVRPIIETAVRTIRCTRWAILCRGRRFSTTRADEFGVCRLRVSD